MPSITRYKAKKRQWGLTFLVEVDGEPWAEIVDETMVARRVERGRDLSPEELEEIRLESEALSRRMRLAHYLAPRVRTREQARRYAARTLGAPEQQAEALAEWAEKRGLVADQAFAQAKARTEKRLGKSGPLKVKAKLLEAGVKRGLAQETAGKLFSQDEQVRACLKLLESRAKRLRNVEDPMKRRQRAAAFLARRGFESEPAREALEKSGLLNEEAFEGD